MGKAPVMVLFYHRIADDQGSPWTLSNRGFAEQIRWLKDHFEMVSLAEAQRRIANRHNVRPMVSITFDDGYAANCDEALPLLIAEKIPCTYFVTSRCVLEQQPFPHDVVKSCAAWPNTLEQIRAMAVAGIEIGAHTRARMPISAGCMSRRKSTKKSWSPARSCSKRWAMPFATSRFRLGIRTISAAKHFI